MLNRRSFLALAGGTLLARTPARADAVLPGRVAIAYEDPGRAIAADFIGLSYESALIAAPDYFTPDNYSLLGLIRALGARGVIRIGGNTSERTVWREGGRAVATGDISATITQAMSGQVDVGWSVAPFNLDQLAKGEIRLVARASDIEARIRAERPEIADVIVHTEP